MRYSLLSAMLLGLLTSQTAFAGHGHKSDKVRCPDCNYVCQLTKEQVTETKHCYDVECKPVCVPPITFPWERGSGKGKGLATPKRCGKVKVVRVLVKEEYECTKCKCKWTAVPAKGKKDGHYDESGEVDAGGEGAPDVPPPPVLEARLRQLRLRTPTTRVGSTSEPTPVSRSPRQPKYLEILTNFLKR